MRKNLYLLLSLSLFFVSSLAGCISGGSTDKNEFELFRLQETGGDAMISVFMELKEPFGPAVWMDLGDLEVFAGEAWLPLAKARDAIHSKEISSKGQILFARGGVKSDRYSKMRVEVKKAALERLGESIFLALDNPVLELNFSSDLFLQKGDSVSVFVTWDTDASVQGALFSPQLNVEIQSIPLTVDLAYVACPDIDTVYIVRTDQNKVCGSIGLSGGPKCIFVNRQKNRLYVLCPDEAAVKIVELSSNRYIDEIYIPHVQLASHMAVDPDGEWAYVLDERGDQLLRLSLLRGVFVDRVRLDSRPRFITFLEQQNLLAVSSAFNQKVVFLDPLTLNSMQSIVTGGSPDGLLFINDSIYIAESSTNTVSVYDLSGNRSRARINVGMVPRRFVFANNNVYLANNGDGTVSILRPGQMNVLRDITVGGKPLEMAVYSVSQWLYVGDEEGRGLSVVDLASNMVVKEIELASPVSGLAVVN